MPLDWKDTIGLDDYVLPFERFQDASSWPVAEIPASQTVRAFIYTANGSLNLSKATLATALPFLEKREAVAARWLRNKIAGKGRRPYGKSAVRAARLAKFRCESCGNGDVRVLHMDHVEGRKPDSEFMVLCANCHNVKSRAHDWMFPKA